MIRFPIRRRLPAVFPLGYAVTDRPTGSDRSRILPHRGIARPRCSPLSEVTMRRNDPLKWMWLDAFQTLERAERLRRHFFELGESGRAPGPTWEPPVDLFENEDRLCVIVALPGAAPARIAVRLEDGQLIVTADRPVPHECRTAVIHRLEIPYGRFERVLPLPAGQYELDHHDVTDGCLVLTLRKT